MRPCVIAREGGEVHADFHQWINDVKIVCEFTGPIKRDMMLSIKSDIDVNGIYASGVKTTPLDNVMALVEYEDGSIGKVEPTKIRFTDHKPYDWTAELPPVSISLKASFEEGAFNWFVIKYNLIYEADYDSLYDRFDINYAHVRGVRITFGRNNKRYDHVISLDRLEWGLLNGDFLRDHEIVIIEKAAKTLGIDLTKEV